MTNNYSHNLERPIIILGPPRSGTTILGAILAQSETLGYFEEPRAVWRYGNESHSDWLNEKHATDAVISYIRTYFSKQLLKKGKCRMLEKTPQNSLRPDFVDAVFPDAMYIFLYRDPLDTIKSIESYWLKHTIGIRVIGRQKLLYKLKQTHPSQLIPYALEFARRILPVPRSKNPRVMWGPRLPGIEAMVRDMSIAEVAAFQWRYCMERVMDFKTRCSKDRFISMRLEELDRHSFGELLDFLSIEPCTNVIEAFNQQFSYEGVRRKRVLSNEFVSSVMPIVEPTRAWMKDHISSI